MVKCMLHCGQEWGFCPVCVAWCLRKSVPLWKPKGSVFIVKPLFWGLSIGTWYVCVTWFTEMEIPLLCFQRFGVMANLHCLIRIPIPVQATLYYAELFILHGVRLRFQSQLQSTWSELESESGNASIKIPNQYPTPRWRKVHPWATITPTHE